MICWIKLGFVLKMNWFCKMTKWDELRWFLEIIRIDLWNVYVYVTALICGLYIYSVEAFEFGYFDFGEIIKNASFYENRRTLWN